MIVNGFLFVLKGIISVLLLPFNAINFVVDFASSIPVVGGFIQVVAYILPWSNLVPIFVIIFALLSFRVTVGFVKFIRIFLSL